MNQSLSALRPGRDFSCRGLALSLFWESCFPQGISTGSGGILDTMSPALETWRGPKVTTQLCLQTFALGLASKLWPFFRPGLKLRATRQLGRKRWQLPGSSPHSPLVSVSAKRGFRSSQSLEGEPRAQVSPQKAEAAPASTHHAPQAAGLESRLFLLFFVGRVGSGHLASSPKSHSFPEIRLYHSVLPPVQHPLPDPTLRRGQEPGGEAGVPGVMVLRRGRASWSCRVA